jgi:hypothetical protein
MNRHTVFWSMNCGFNSHKITIGLGSVRQTFLSLITHCMNLYFMKKFNLFPLRFIKYYLTLNSARTLSYTLKVIQRQRRILGMKLTSYYENTKSKKVETLL